MSTWLSRVLAGEWEEATGTWPGSAPDGPAQAPATLLSQPVEFQLVLVGPDAVVRSSVHFRSLDSECKMRRCIYLCCSIMPCPQCRQDVLSQPLEFELVLVGPDAVVRSSADLRFSSVVSGCRMHPCLHDRLLHSNARMPRQEDSDCKRARTACCSMYHGCAPCNAACCTMASSKSRLTGKPSPDQGQGH